MSIPNIVYNINVQSKFSLFMDDEILEAEPDEIERKIQVEKKKKESAQKEAKKMKTHKPAKVEAEVAKPEEKKVTERAPRFQKMDNRFAPKPINTEKPPNEEDTEQNRLKNRKNSANPPRKFRGREYDRHSGSDKTGVKHVDKRDGSGAHNWGTLKDDIEVSQEQSAPKDDVEKVSDNEPQPEGEKKEDEKATMTYAEWRALNKENAVISANNRNRAANNGVDVFSGMNAYKKRNKNASESDNEVVVPDDDFDSKGRREIKVNVEFTGRSRRGGRGGFNNPRINREDTRNREKKPEKDVLINLDENEFPVLS